MMSELRFYEKNKYLAISAADTNDRVTIEMDDTVDGSIAYQSISFSKDELNDIIKWLKNQVKVME